MIGSHIAQGLGFVEHSGASSCWFPFSLSLRTERGRGEYMLYVRKGSLGGVRKLGAGEVLIEDCPPSPISTYSTYSHSINTLALLSIGHPGVVCSSLSVIERTSIEGLGIRHKVLD